MAKLRDEAPIARDPAVAGGRVTLRDVARRVGVHASTVSRALNPSTRHMVAADIAGRVTAAAEALGYRPNPIAYGLKTNRTLTVGVVIPDLTNPVFPPIIRGIEDALGRAGYTAVIANTDNDLARERLNLESMRARRVDGMILATARRDDPLLAEYRADGTPLVLVNRDADDHAIRSVVSDDTAGIALSVAHLAGLGHVRIADIAGPQSLSTGFERHQAYLASMARHGLAVEPDLVVFCDAYSVEAGRKALSWLLQRRRDFTAAIAGNDLIALGCYDALRAHGLTCPDDLSIAGFNDMPFIDKMAPPLTTVRIRHYDLGAEAARLLLAEIGGETRKQAAAEPARMRLPCELVVRGSTAAVVGG